MYPRQKIELRELDRRSSDGIEVELLWDPRTGRVLVVVEDTILGDSFEFEVEAAHALAAFHHPYAYVAEPDLSACRHDPV